MEENEKLETKRIAIFLAFTFIVTYTIEILITAPLFKEQTLQIQTSVLFRFFVAMPMFIPALGVIFTRLVTREGFKTAMLKPKFRGNIKYYLFAWFAPILLTIAGTVVYFLIFPKNFDITMKTVVDSYVMLYEESGMGGVFSREEIKTAIITQIPMVIILPFMNLVTCFGEEWGWRGYLLPKMQKKLKMIPMLIINGVIWGLWHMPLTVVGHNYGTDYPGFPVMGIIAMCVFCTVVGVIFSYITTKTDSVWPSTLAHASMNSCAYLSLIFYNGTPNPFIGPSPTGVIGGIGYIVTAVIMTILLVKMPSSKTND